MAKKAPASANEAPIFDFGAYHEELTALRQKHLSGITSQIEALEAQQDEIETKLGALRKTRDQIEGRTTPSAVGGGKRSGRRDPAELKAEAEALVAYVKKNPGEKGKKILEATGITLNKPYNVKSFIEKYLPDVKVKTDGVKAGMTYAIG